MPEKFSHCHHCGAAYADGQPWPRLCAACGSVTYRNPLPVSVVLLPVGRGLLAVRRAIPPGAGKLALPGGYVNFGESWEEAGARELFEETGVRIDPGELESYRVLSASDGTLLVFGRAKRRAARALPDYRATDETTERVVLTGPEELAFDLHTRVVADYFARGRRRR
jgi:ADP-ribose pyrophosphatase YjhB (NUDIX family)